MFQKLNIQYFLSYFGLFPFIYILIDKYFFFQIKEDIVINFLIYYNLLIIVFIGSINWNFEIKIKNYIAIYGFLPSLFAVFIILLNLYKFNYINLIISLIFFYLFQLFLNYFLIYYSKSEKKPFYLLRLPLTIIIVVILIVIIIL